jgi:hypothetical protein
LGYCHRSGLFALCILTAQLRASRNPASLGNLPGLSWNLVSRPEASHRFSAASNEPARADLAMRRLLRFAYNDNGATTAIRALPIRSAATSLAEIKRITGSSRH